MALVAFVGGMAVGNQPSVAVVTAGDYAAAWSKQDFAAMHALLSTESRERVSADEFEQMYLDAQRLATVKTISPGEPGQTRSAGSGEVVPIPLTLITVAFGTINAPIELEYVEDGIHWSPRLTFPTLRNGEVLSSSTRLPERAPIRSRDGVALAEGPGLARSSPLGGAAIDVAGTVGMPDAGRQQELTELGLPVDTPVGLSGLERAYNTELTGTPGGVLTATRDGQSRVLASADPQRGPALKTTIDSELQLAAVGALAGRSGGIIALDTRSGAIRALAGQAYSAPQPPGSTFKVLTAAAAFEQRLIKLDDYYEPVTGVNVGGRFIRNAHGESCGGDFRQVFAKSCNSAFLPLGPELGSDGLVEISERFGFNSTPQLFNESATALIDPPKSTIPTEITNEEELGVSAIGQGRVLATPLQMASVAQTIANDGIRMPTPIVQTAAQRPDAKPTRVMPKRIANLLGDLMVGVVAGGTGSSGAIAEAQVAGKTGTAELGPKPDQSHLEPGDEPEQMVNAWFIAYAPAKQPRLAVAVMLVNADADGGTVAAPAAAQVLAAGID